MNIFTDIGNKVIIVDGIHYSPIISSGSVAVHYFSTKAAIAHTDQCIRYGYMHLGTVRFIALVIFAGIPNAGTQALAGNAYPGTSVLAFSPDQSSIPWWATCYTGFTVVVYSYHNYLIFTNTPISTYTINKVCITIFKKFDFFS